MSYGSNDRGYTWVYALSMLRGFDEAPIGSVKGASVALLPMAEGTYDFEIWNTYTGKIVERGTAVVADRQGRLIIPLPEFSGDVALKYFRKE
jgi:hypothetical protein